MPAEDVFKVSLFSHNEQRQFITTHYYESGVVVTSDPFEEGQALADAFLTAWQTLYVNVLSNETFLGCIKVEQVKGAGLPTWISHLTDIKGSRAGPALPNNMVVIIRRRGISAGKQRRSLVFLSGVRSADTDGSFINAAFITPALEALVDQYNNQIVASASFQLAEYNPVIPRTERVYGNNLNVTIDTALNTMTIIGGQTWSGLGFVSGGRFSIRHPNRNKGTYTATVVPASTTITLSDNELETSGSAELSCSQVITGVVYITLQSAVQQLAIRQLNRRRSSYTGILA